MRLHNAYHHQNDQVVNFSARPTGCSGGERERDELDVERSRGHGHPQRAYVTGDIVDDVVIDQIKQQYSRPQYSHVTGVKVNDVDN